MRHTEIYIEDVYKQEDLHSGKVFFPNICGAYKWEVGVVGLFRVISYEAIC